MDEPDFVLLDALVPLSGLHIGCLSWDGFGIQVGDELLHPCSWRSGTHMATCLSHEPEHTHTRKQVSKVIMRTYADDAWMFVSKDCVLTRRQGWRTAGWSWCSSTLGFYASACHWKLSSISSVQNRACLPIKTHMNHFKKKHTHSLSLSASSFYLPFFNFLCACMRRSLILFLFLVLLSCSIVYNVSWRTMTLFRWKKDRFHLRD